MVIPQRTLPKEDLAATAAYIHVPFCAHRCGYCNFTVVAGRDDLVEPYLAALEQELAQLETPRPVQTLFVGGGTPTHLPPAALRRFFALLARWHPLRPGGEFSCEANPVDIAPETVEILAAAGINRVSLGAQSFAGEKLARLERDHDAARIRRAVELLRPRVRSLSLDLIFAAPGESLAAWQADLEAALALRPDHVSTYGLTFEQGTTFWGRLRRGELHAADEQTEGAMYAAAIDRLTAAGFEHYEVSNFAQPGHRCRHNEVYWTQQSYYAAGPGAARFVDGRREVNHRSTSTWLRRVSAGQSPVAESETLDAEDAARERLVFGLRRLAGVNRQQFAAAAGCTIDSLVGPRLAQFVKHGLLVDDGATVRLTRRGLFVSDSIWPEFLQRNDSYSTASRYSD